MESFTFEKYLPKLSAALERFEEIHEVEKHMNTEKAERMKWKWSFPTEFTDAMRELFLPLFNDELL